MRPHLVFLLVACVPLAAQQNMPVGIVRGRLLALNDRPAAKRGLRSSGEFTVQSADGNVYGCEYDAHTLFERDRDVVRPDVLRAGDPVEVVSDRRGGGCYTRMLSVTFAKPEAKARPARGHLEDARVSGYLTVSGLVVRYGPESMTVRTRSGDATVLLRADTRYSGDGVRLESPTIVLNKHVFIQGGRDIHGTLVAYRVMWGDALLAP